MVTGRLRVVSSFGDGDCGAAKYTRARAKFRGESTQGERRMYFARPTIVIAKIRDYSQSRLLVNCLRKLANYWGNFVMDWHFFR